MNMNMNLPITLTMVVRYILPGTMTLMLFVFLPGIVFSVDFIERVLNISGVILALVLGVLLGYLLDLLKISRLTFGYKKVRAELINSISDAFNIEKGESLALLSKAANMEEKEEGDIFVIHTKWVMSTKCVFVFYLSFIVWVILFVLSLIGLIGGNFVICLCISLISLIIGIRLNYAAILEQKRLTRSYIHYIKSNADVLLKGYVNESKNI